VRDTRPQEFLDEQLRTMSRWFMWPACVLVLLGLVTLPVDFGAYAAGTREGVVRHSAFGDSLLPWDALERVETGCAEFPSGSPRRFTLYELVFSSGARVTALFHPTARAVDRLAELDAIFRARGLPFRRAVFRGGANVGKPVWTEGCPQALASAIGADAGRVHKLFEPTAR
jgi:hypothetical protein